MAQHSFTPGPWTAKDDPLVPERGAIYISAKGRFDPEEVIGEAYKTDGDVDDGSLSETEANARLIAAAPDLLTALENLLDLDERCGWFSKQADAARAAIKRATEA